MTTEDIRRTKLGCIFGPLVQDIILALTKGYIFERTFKMEITFFSLTTLEAYQEKYQFM